MSFPVSSEQAVTAIAALDAPSTLRNSRRRTPGLPFVLMVLTVVSFAGTPFASPLSCCSMSVVAVGAVVARLLSLCDWRGTWRRRLLGVSGGLEPLLRAVAVHMAADAPAHVEARVLIDARHVLDLAMACLTRDAGVHVPHVREVDVLGKLVDAHPRNRLRARLHAQADGRRIGVLIELLQFRARAL